MMYENINTHNTTKRPTNSSSTVSEQQRKHESNKNYFNEVQYKQSQYAFHQHGYDLSAYTQMVSAGIDPEQAILNIQYFYKNLYRIEKAETT